MNVLAIALYSKLTGDTGAGGVANATTGATGGFHRGVAPQDATFPRVEFFQALLTPSYAFANLNADNVYYQIKVVAIDPPNGGEEGVAVASRLSERMRVLLTDPGMSVTGKTLLYCRFDRSIPPYSEWDDANGRYVYHDGGIYQLWLA